MKYMHQSSSTHCSKVSGKVKVFKKLVNLQGQGHRVKNVGIDGKSCHNEYSSEISNMRALALTFQK